MIFFYTLKIINDKPIASIDCIIYFMPFYTGHEGHFIPDVRLIAAINILKKISHDFILTI